MSKNVKVNGVTYNGVSTVKMQTADGGEAIFYDSAPATPPAESDINFWDYDGTLLYSWTLAELAAKTELPPLPSHDGLVCQGWNWTLEDIKSVGHAVDVGAMYITDDGKTRIYIHLEEGRTSPMLGCCPNGTVTVDWGDGTTPDTLTGTSTTTVKWTPNHAYAAPGDYVIKLTVDGTVGFYGASANNENSGLLRFASSAFQDCTGLAALTIPGSVESIAASAFQGCSGIKFYDFTGHTAVPTLANANAFSGIAADCEIRVPAALADTWKAATNWSTYADQIVGVSAE